jgi:Asp-tRNA(Asn)/Glu-tRNA(Gln) amidotransferase A subunit family amidase
MNSVKVLAAVYLLICFSFSAAQTISKDLIENSEKIIGLEFSDAERDSMVDNLNEQLQSYINIRNYLLKNSIPPSLDFNPIPVKFHFPDEQLQLRYSSYAGIRLPADINDLAFFSIGELAELIRTKQITSVKLTEFYLERLKKYDPVLHCVISLTEERGLRQARLMDQELESGKYRGLLHGIPFGIKDLLATSDYKTTWGAAPFKDQMIKEDASVLTKLEEAGGVLVAKLTMGALAWGDVWFGGMTRNPWDTSSGSSGSSAGSASAVSAGLVPFAIGTETWGSIISPSTVCGNTGLRPTYGRVSRTGAMALSWSMDKIGPICRTSEDLAIVFDAIQGTDGFDQTLYSVPFNYTPEIDYSGIRIGYLKSDFDKDYPFKKNDSLTLARLQELGAVLIPVELPVLPVSDLSIILSAEAAAVFDELTRSNQDDMLVRQVKNAWPNSFRSARFIPAVEYINANRVRFILIQQMQKIMDDIDIYAAPSWEGDNLLLTNLTGHPCVVVPNGFSDEGTPTSISFTGRLFDEGRLIAFAKKYQDSEKFHLIHPEMFRK